MAPDPIAHSGKALRVRRWRLVVIAHVDMRQRRTSLIGLFGALDLLGRRNRDRRIILLAGTEPVIATATTTGSMLFAQRSI
jgi:hypothetical protein